MASVNTKRSIPENNPDIRDAMELIMKDMLKAQKKIIYHFNVKKKKRKKVFEEIVYLNIVSKC